MTGLAFRLGLADVPQQGSVRSGMRASKPWPARRYDGFHGVPFCSPGVAAVCQVHVSIPRPCPSNLQGKRTLCAVAGGRKPSDHQVDYRHFADRNLGIGQWARSHGKMWHINRIPDGTRLEFGGNGCYSGGELFRAITGELRTPTEYESRARKMPEVGGMFASCPPPRCGARIWVAGLGPQHTLSQS